MNPFLEKTLGIHSEFVFQNSDLMFKDRSVVQSNAKIYQNVIKTKVFKIGKFFF